MLQALPQPRSLTATTHPRVPSRRLWVRFPHRWRLVRAARICFFGQEGIPWEAARNYGSLLRRSAKSSSRPGGSWHASNERSAKRSFARQRNIFNPCLPLTETTNGPSRSAPSLRCAGYGARVPGSKDGCAVCFPRLFPYHSLKGVVSRIGRFFFAQLGEQCSNVPCFWEFFVRIHRASGAIGASEDERFGHPPREFRPPGAPACWEWWAIILMIAAISFSSRILSRRWAFVRAERIPNLP